MAKSKILGPDGLPCGGDIASDFAAAARYGLVRVGEQGLYWRAGTQRQFLPYVAFDRAFLRIRPIPAKVCCGRIGLEQYWVVLMRGVEELAQIEVRDQPRGDIILSTMAKHHPTLTLGAPRDENR